MNKAEGCTDQISSSMLKTGYSLFINNFVLFCRQ